jgi:hypothetical protein
MNKRFIFYNFKEAKKAVDQTIQSLEKESDQQIPGTEF